MWDGDKNNLLKDKVDLRGSKPTVWDGDVDGGMTALNVRPFVPSPLGGTATYMAKIGLRDGNLVLSPLGGMATKDAEPNAGLKPLF